TTHASGRSTQVGCGTATTAASRTCGWAIIMFSRSTLEIHSPPDLMHFLGAIVNLEIPLRIKGRNIAGLNPAIRSKTVGRVEAIVATGDPRTSDLDFAHGGAISRDYTS